jgi:uncharacterized protein YfaP (DUF2135 family)
MKNGLLIASVILVIAVAAIAAVMFIGDTSESGLLLEVTTPQNESVVTSSEILVSGNTDADAVVSVNGDLVDIDAQGEFSTPLTLEEGPNYIEVVASNYDGEESSESLTVIYVA